MRNTILCVAQRTLYDIRDGNSYVVAKLADGNCWMTSNLKYSIAANTTRIGANHSTNRAFDFDTGTSCGQDGACIMNGDTAMNDNGYDGYKYSWYAATAGTGTSSTVGEATGSICPKGWRLPANYTTSASKSYGSITQAYLGLVVNTSGDYTAKLEAAPLSFKRAGFYHDGAFYSGGTAGIYWSSTASTTANGYGLYYMTTFTYPQYSGVKYYGLSVRCVNTDL